MSAYRITRRADRNKRTAKRLAAIEAEIVGLPDEDLLDLADIFTGVEGSVIGSIAEAEMARRGISL